MIEEPRMALRNQKRRQAGVIALALLTVSAIAGLTLTNSAGAQKATAKRSASSVAGLSVSPAEGTLDGSYSFQTLVAVGKSIDGSERDLTNLATYASTNSAVVKVDKSGIAYPVSDGSADVIVSQGGRSVKAHLTVRNTKTNSRLSFETSIAPILIKSGCMGTACHGAPNGQAGFKLSFFGYETEKDWTAVVRGKEGKRVNFKDPEKSLFLMKPTAAVWHGGGRKFRPDGPEARVFAAWIKAGAPYVPGRTAFNTDSKTQLASYPKLPAAPKLDSVYVLPTNRTIRDANSKHQLVVMARYKDGSEADVTPFARYFCDDDGIATVSSEGRLLALRKGEANVMVRYAGKVGISSVMVQPQTPMANYPSIKSNNYVDEHILAKLKQLNMLPSDIADDATFVRRVFFDLIGTPPLPAMVRQFVDDDDKNKRSKLIDELLERPEYKDYQTIIWADLLRNTRILLKDGVEPYTHFIRESFAENKPFDKFVRELLTGKGSAYQNETATANYYRVTNDPSELTTSTSQIFMGVRLECCRCHNHPFDRWMQDDFYGMAAFFAKTHQRDGVGKDEIIIFNNDSGEVRQLRTQQVMSPKFITAEKPLETPQGDLRTYLADWITSKENPYFAKATVNRLWKQFFGRGIVHPADDFRASNPPINPPLLDALAKDFLDHNFDVKYIIRVICNSRAYQTSSKPNGTNGDDNKNFSRYYIRRLAASQLLDAITVATDVPEKFPGVREGTPAINLADNSVPSYFLDVFGRSNRLQVAEPSQQTTIAQALALINGPAVNARLTNPNGFLTQKILGRLGDRSEKDLLDTLYLNVLARFPTAAESKSAKEYLTTMPTAKEGYEDLMWALLNSKEFMFNH